MSATFAEWLTAVFDHGVNEPEWYWDSGFDEYWSGFSVTEELTIQYMTRLFKSPDCLSRYSLDQVAQGIWFLIGEASPAQPSRILVDSLVPLDGRLECVRAMRNFFRDFVAPAAPNDSRSDDEPFHTACYMWWDIFPYWGDPDVGGPELQNACLCVMEGVLRLPSELCQISALHGLNHWHLHHRAAVERIVSSFLDTGATLSPRIRDYALLAIRGCAQ